MDKTSLLAQINATPPAQIAELEFVKTRFIENFNLANKSTDGDLMYHRQLVHFNQTIAANSQLANADRFSLYACFVTAAVNGYSFDPEDNEVYLVAYKGKATLMRQAGAHVRRLIRTGQIQFVEQAKIVYEGDLFQVENGRVIRHVENFQSENVIAAYARFVLDVKGTDRFFIYKRSDFEAWRKKSSNPKSIMKSGSNGSYLSESPWDSGVIDGTVIEPGFLRTKIIKHSCKEKCWATGSTPAGIETFSVEIDADDITPEMLSGEVQEEIPAPKVYTEFEETITQPVIPVTEKAPVTAEEEDAF